MSSIAISHFLSPARVDPARRVSIAIVVSILVHLLALLCLRDSMHNWPPSSPHGIGSLPVLQAILQGPEILIESEPAPPMTAAAEVPEQAAVAALADSVAQAPPGHAASAPETGSNMMSGAADPPVMITSRAVPNAIELGTRYAQLLAQRFPDPVAKRPEILTSLVLLYPRPAIDAHAQARILALLTISETGEIIEQTLIPNDPIFGPAVSEALKEARFSPAEIDAKAVRYWTILEFEFSIEHRKAARAPHS
jgi:hypothetical protein